MAHCRLRTFRSWTATRTGKGREGGLRGGPTQLRGGTIYVAVLGVALIVGVFAAAAMHIARIELHHAVSADQVARARLAAQSGIEYAISVINGNSDWRTEYASDDLPTIGSLTSTETFSFSLIDDDGDLSDDEQDWVTLRSVGTSGSATSVAEVRLQPAGLGLDCLDSSLHGAGNVTVDANLSMQRVSSNGNIQIVAGRTLTVTQDAWAVQTISGTVSPTVAALPNQPIPREMPDSESVFEYYKTNGTWISPPGGTIEEELLSPDHNPFGAETNPQGIYLVDCGGASITLRECRIVGTLVLLNAGPGTLIKDCIMIEPAVPNFPALMVEGPLEMDWDYTTIISEDGLSINLNPLGLPIGGLIDATLGGSWTGEIKGLVYLTGNLVLKNKEPKIDGVVVAGGTVNVTNRVNHTHDSTIYFNPPPGFTADSKMKIVPGTWKRVALP